MHCLRFDSAHWAAVSADRATRKSVSITSKFWRKWQRQKQQLDPGGPSRTEEDPGGPLTNPDTADRALPCAQRCSLDRSRILPN
uniref:Uncharacterized protein n=1 Tax=Knipowitschia caucasica TaxID=637954 RepID=A0AAV2KWP8_KNICA